MEGIINGIRIVFCLQLLLVGGFLIFNKRERNYPLALLCLLVGLYFLWQFILPILRDNISLFFIFFSREIFIPPLLYLTLLRIGSSVNRKTFIKHLTIPLVISVPTALFLTLFYDKVDTRFIGNAIYQPSIIIFSIVYLVKGRKLLKDLKNKIVKKAYIKYKVFFYVIMYTYLIIGVTSFLSYFVQLKFLLKYYGTSDGRHITDTGNILIDIAGKLFEGPLYYFGWYVFEPLLYIIPIFLFVFALSELSYFKTLFLPKDVFYSDRVLSNSNDLASNLEFYFENEKPFKNPSFNIEQCCAYLDCTKKELADFLKLHKKTTFNNYINIFRIKEFKLLLAEEVNNLYDINSLAEMAGFKSRATFYRIFKDVEGVTPTQYKNNY
ncbi:MAG: helix-turn-helix domain-containing protein [Flavobacteriaceae bacterium]|nr:helix-turn-helix domain-containing protein [Flavobacteriaceae bacterium]